MKESLSKKHVRGRSKWRRWGEKARKPSNFNLCNIIHFVFDVVFSAWANGNVARPSSKYFFLLRS